MGNRADKWGRGERAAWRKGAAFPLGPYVQTFPVNSINGLDTVGAAPSKTTGWVYIVNGNQFTFRIVDTTGTGVLP